MNFNLTWDKAICPKDSTIFLSSTFHKYIYLQMEQSSGATLSPAPCPKTLWGFEQAITWVVDNPIHLPGPHVLAPAIRAAPVQTTTTAPPLLHKEESFILGGRQIPTPQQRRSALETKNILSPQWCDYVIVTEWCWTYSDCLSNLCLWGNEGAGCIRRPEGILTF